MTNPDVSSPPDYQALDANLTIFKELRSAAEDCLKRGAAESAIVYAQIAAHFAWTNPGGIYASPELERLLLAIGRRRIGNRAREKRTIPPVSAPSHVLHILTKAYRTGGHTRLVARWIAQDIKRIHSIAITRQQRDIPSPELLESVTQTGGKIWFLDRTASSLLSRARQLEALAAKADQVVVHSHPYDPVPILALTNRASATILVNHADHVFWLGTSIADVVVQIRAGSLELSTTQRGIDKHRCFIMPIPIDSSRSLGNKAQAKADLGLPSDSILLLSVAAPYKFLGEGTIPMADLLLPLIHKHKNLYLFVVGPCSDSEWRDAMRRSNGKIRACGEVLNPSPYYDAADIYLESFPTGSLTALLEAGAHALPLITYYPYGCESILHCGDDPALDQDRIVTFDVDAYIKLISGMVTTESLREQTGARTAASIHNYHGPVPWAERLEQLYHFAREQKPLAEVPIPQRKSSNSPLDGALLRMHKNGGLASGLHAVLYDHCRLFPLRQRIKTWRQIQRSIGGRHLRLLLPEFSR